MSSSGSKFLCYRENQQKNKGGKEGKNERSIRGSPEEFLKQLVNKNSFGEKR